MVIYESGEATYKDEVPPEIPPLSVAGLYLRSSLTTVHPQSRTEEGAPTTYVRNWAYTYIAASNEDVAAALSQFYQRLKSPPE